MDYLTFLSLIYHRIISFIELLARVNVKMYITYFTNTIVFNKY
jgi:hypothetical protein